MAVLVHVSRTNDRGRRLAESIQLIRSGLAVFDELDGMRAQTIAVSAAVGEIAGAVGGLVAAHYGTKAAIKKFPGLVHKSRRAKPASGSSSNHRGHSAASQRALNKKLSTPSARRKTAEVISGLGKRKKKMSLPR